MLRVIGAVSHFTDLPFLGVSMPKTSLRCYIGTDRGKGTKVAGYQANAATAKGSFFYREGPLGFRVGFSIRAR